MAINRGSVEYYNLEKVAEVLSISTAEVNRLREQSKLRGLRDGSTWKFNKEEIHTYLADSIRARSSNEKANIPEDDDFSLADEESVPSFDILVEDAALPDDSDLVSVAPSTRLPSDLDLAALDHDSDLALAEETHVSAVAVPQKTEEPAEPASEIAEVLLDEDDASALLLLSPESYAVELDDESALIDGGASPQLELADNSGLDVLLDQEEPSDVLDIGKEEYEVSASESADFDLEPSQVVWSGDDSESSSQVIAVDVALAETMQESADSLGLANFDTADFAEFGSGVSSPAGPTSGDPFGMPGVTDDFGSTFTPAVAVTPKKPATPVEEYSTGMLVALSLTLAVLLLPCLVILDTMIHMWSWEEPFILNGVLMNEIAKLFNIL